MIEHNITSALVAPSGVCTIADNLSFKTFTGFITDPLVASILKLSPCLKMSIKNGLNIPSETTPKVAAKMLKLKYAATREGYLLMYLKIVLRLFMYASKRY